MTKRKGRLPVLQSTISLPLSLNKRYKREYGADASLSKGFFRDNMHYIQRFEQQRKGRNLVLFKNNPHCCLQTIKQHIDESSSGCYQLHDYFNVTVSSLKDLMHAMMVSLKKNDILTYQADVAIFSQLCREQHLGLLSIRANEYDLISGHQLVYEAFEAILKSDPLVSEFHDCTEILPFKSVLSRVSSSSPSSVSSSVSSSSSSSSDCLGSSTAMFSQSTPALSIDGVKAQSGKKQPGAAAGMADEGSPEEFTFGLAPEEFNFDLDEWIKTSRQKFDEAKKQKNTHENGSDPFKKYYKLCRQYKNTELFGNHIKNDLAANSKVAMVNRLLNKYGYIDCASKIILTVTDRSGALCGIALLSSADESFDLDLFAVHPSHQGKGLGNRLLQYCKKYFNYFRSCRSFNDFYIPAPVLLARRFYKKHGFEQQGDNQQGFAFSIDLNSVTQAAAVCTSYYDENYDTTFEADDDDLDNDHLSHVCDSAMKLAP